MGVLVTFLGLTQAIGRKEKIEEVRVNDLEEREEMKLKQLESDLNEDENQEVVDIVFYL